MVKHAAGSRAWWAAMAMLFLLAYGGSYLAWSRGFPAREGVRDGRRSFGFFVRNPDWEYSVVAFCAPRIRLDAAWGGRIHVFDLKYL